MYEDPLKEISNFPFKIPTLLPVFCVVVLVVVVAVVEVVIV